jgi:hypothetical protein
MKYEKPEMTVMPSAAAAIQSASKGMGLPDSAHQPTVGAYEADE